MQKTIIYIFEKIRRNGFSFEFRILDVKFLGVVTYFVPFDKPGYLEVVFSSLDFINILENCPRYNIAAFNSIKEHLLLLKSKFTLLKVKLEKLLNSLLILKVYGS